MSVIRDNLGKIILLAVALAVAVAFYKTPEQRATEEKKEAEGSLAMSASLAGSALASAFLSCREIGFLNNLEGCSTYKGQLVQEMGAPISASTALSMRSDFWTACGKAGKTKEQCAPLLQRAMILSLPEKERP